MPVFGADGLQVATATSVLLFGPQVVVVQLLPASPVAGVHEATPVGPVRSTGQVVVV